MSGAGAEGRPHLSADRLQGCHAAAHHDRYLAYHDRYHFHEGYGIQLMTGIQAHHDRYSAHHDRYFSSS
jgi:hypothetical protein